MGIGPVVHQFRHLFEGRSIAGVPEGQLLRRYLDGRDEVAFEAIVTRHGPMVLGVCRRVLVDARDVEDAFQATFVILARKGGTLAEGDPIGHWLYGVAYRVALRARASAARRRAREGVVKPLEFASPDDPTRSELASTIDEELARLPSKYRRPVVLCYLEGLTHDEAARQLGWPLGTVKGRLSRARDLLKGRLTRRGVAPGGVFALARSARVVVPPALIELAIRAVPVGPSAGVVPAAVSSLVAGSLTTMLLNKLKAAGVAILLLGSGAAVMAYQMSQGTDEAPAKDRAKVAVAKAAANPPASTDSEATEWVAGWPQLTSQQDNNPGTKAILKVLEEPVSMNFTNETPLMDVIKYIQAATEKSPGLPTGLPIYVDPQAMQDSDKTLADTVRISLEGIPLKTTLRLLLKQASLDYQVKDGLLIVTSLNSADEVTPFGIMENKALRGELTREQYKQLIEALKLRLQVQTLTREINKPNGFQ